MITRAVNFLNIGNQTRHLQICDFFNQNLAIADDGIQRVRSSWLIFARNLLFVALASSAWAFACWVIRSQPVEPSVVQPPDLAFAHESQLPVSCAETSRQLSRFVGSTSNLGNLGRIKFADLLSRDRVAGNAASDRRQLIEGMNHSSLQQPVDQHDCCKIEAKCPSSTLDIAALA